MKVGIGIRATPKAVYYCVVTETEDAIEITQVDKLVVPQAISLPEQLKFLRATFLDITEETSANLACIRAAESSAQSPSIERMYIEGVILELIASSGIARYYVGAIASIAAKLGIERNQFKPLALGKEVFEGIDFWGKISVESRESILAAFSALRQ